MIDDGEADDKIIAVLENDLVYGDVQDVGELPQILVERIRHYFSTYKLVVGESSPVSIGPTYGKDHATKVIEASMADYEDEYGG